MALPEKRSTEAAANKNDFMIPPKFVPRKFLSVTCYTKGDAISAP
jgi:hypothetical protein